ncbi:hypothetical protein FSB78_12185 [Sphingomonas ginsenosidivorax]|uniref:DUF3617 family protein n=1 Tax=Sphingomonas ginsenosidivorax TaxID=862135 RepID=A0A5C6UFQ9_9SPHN|nr:hypothetical protein [Sphingomonas ginsenosidivorax]TXC71623.1 hypothetical protein FSB78_12185 [Sphingomonas ginsenosidivorax]
MIHPALPVTLFALAAPAAAMVQSDLDGLQIAQMSIHERIIIRVPRMSHAKSRPSEATAPEFKEHKGPKCVAVGDIAGAALGKPGVVDLMMDNGTRLRAKLDGDCKPLDYYTGFYIRPAADGLICQDRDAIRMRSGATCEIEGFKSLRIKR